MSSVTSVSAESVASGTKKKFEKIRYEGWDTYLQVLNERKIRQDVINKLKIFLVELEEIYGETINIKYSPSMISVIHINKYGKSARVMAIFPRKKFIVVEFTTTEKELIEKYPDYPFKRGMLFFQLGEDNNFEYKQYLDLISDKINILNID
jgi:hypothetical protein